MVANDGQSLADQSQRSLQDHYGDEGETTMRSEQELREAVELVNWWLGRVGAHLSELPPEEIAKLYADTQLWRVTGADCRTGVDAG